MSTTEEQNLSLLLVRNKMREQIKELQEKRAAAMMNEITELQKERDISLARLKQAETHNAELKEENWLLKESCGREADLKLELVSVNQQFMEEKLLVNDLKKKLQSSEKKNTELLQATGRPLTIPSYYSPSLRASMQHATLRILENESKDRSQSMNDLTSNQCQTSSDTSTTTGTNNQQSSNLQVHSAMSSPMPSPFSSPGVIPRRYKLATVSTCHQETQTEVASPDQQESLLMENLPRPVIEALSAAKEDLVLIQDQNKNLTNKLMKCALEKEEREAREKQITEKHEVLKQESAVLRESLSQFSQWVQHKISSVEEELDICKVIYSLHGSLSKERETIEDLIQKLVSSESKINELSAAKEYLTKTLTDTQNQLVHSKAEAKLLREQLRKALKHSSQHHTHYRIAASTSSPSPLLKVKGSRLSNSPKTRHRNSNIKKLGNEYI